MLVRDMLTLLNDRDPNATLKLLSETPEGVSIWVNGELVWDDLEDYRIERKQRKMGIKQIESHIQNLIDYPDDEPHWDEADYVAIYLQADE